MNPKNDNPQNHLLRQQNPNPITPESEQQQQHHQKPPIHFHNLLEEEKRDSPIQSISDIVVFRDEDEEEVDESGGGSPSSSDIDDSSSSQHQNQGIITSSTIVPSELRTTPVYINTEPHISSQFYTFNRDSYALMVQCILERRLATTDEIQKATPRSVLKSWRSVWKDRNEDTAYLTAWKRIQDKLNAHIDAHGNQVLYFKNNAQQYVSHVNQWQDIVMTYHSDGDLKHLGLKETIDRIKQIWTVGAKFYGIPESFIRVCVSSCLVCNGPSGSSGKNKRRRFEYTETFELPAKEVPQRLQQLAVKHKVVLCIRQKYIRYKPFMAEVKDYACHRAGQPSTKKSKLLKREPYASKRCGCGFRIRAIVPIENYKEKDKTFVYQDEGMAVFKLYAVHSGHEPGPLDGNARIVHRVVGHKGVEMLMDQEIVYGMNEDMETVAFGLMGKDDGDLQLSVMLKVQELKAEAALLDGKVGKYPQELLGSLSQELSDIINRLRSIGEDVSGPVELHIDKQQSDDVLVEASDLAHWGDHEHDHMYGDGKDTDLIEDDEDSFRQPLDDVVPWDQMRADCRSSKSLLSENCKPDRWLKDTCGEFDEKSILDCEDSKLIKPSRHDGTTIMTDSGVVGIQVDSFYPESSKWYDSPCSLDPSADCGDSGFRPGEIVGVVNCIYGSSEPATHAFGVVTMWWFRKLCCWLPAQGIHLFACTNSYRDKFFVQDGLIIDGTSIK
ncbi:hypothetical protein C5167_005042 [Papaver somniferum]|uniref:Uncharacterized protein n=2 Tax=Papaver somniferum TaxID=3469 RepID=A0A4Y7JCW4_PAPSO|nr:hypothetical protein C5167_005042 [Papaver somniferum]